MLLFKKKGGNITGEVIGKRQLSTVAMKGLKIPCVYSFSSSNARHMKLLKEKATDQQFSLKIL